MTRAAKAGLHLGLLALLLGLVTMCSQCSEQPPPAKLSEAAERGRKAFALFCGACHNANNPHQKGQLGVQGPPVARSSRELLEARVLRAEYPPGYVPKQAGNTMQALTYVQPHLADIEAFLAEVPEPAK